jgi:septation ring formation regulator EzrA
MSSESVNPWEEANEEAKEEAKEETQEESVDIAANDSTVGESALVTQKPLSTESPMTTFEEARRASDLRNAEAVLKDLENRYAQLRGEKEQVQTFFESIQIQLEDALQENKKMRETLQGKEKEADESQRESRFLKEKCTTLELDCQAKDERLNRLTREADDLREEVR